MLDIHRERLEMVTSDSLLMEALHAVFDELIDYEKATKKNVSMSNENLGAFMRAYNERLILKEEFFKVIDSTKKIEQKPREKNPGR